LPLLLDALPSVADVQAVVASEPNAKASNTNTADKTRDAFMVSLLRNVRSFLLAGNPIGDARDATPPSLT
jgi:hypothetical protein